MAKELYSNILTRLPAALVIAVITFGMLCLESFILVCIFMVGIGFLLCYEWLQLSARKVNLTQIIFFITPALLFAYFGKGFAFYFLSLSLSFWFVYGCLLSSGSASQVSGIKFNNNYLGIFLIQALICGVVSILTFPDFGNYSSYFILFLLLLITALIDVAAYLVGSIIGKTPLFPELSPNKTLEGFFGALILTYLFIGLLHWLALISFKIFILLALVMPFAFAGDYFESQLKRNQQVKDSGSLIPGHGGIWDRLDSHIAVIPVFAALCLLFI